MIPIEAMAVFFAASVVLALAPGPDNIFVLTQSAINGRVSGLLVTLGLCTGLLVHSFLVAFGVAAIFQESAVAFRVLTLFGAAYLLYLAWQAFSAEPLNASSSDTPQQARRTLYLRGLVMNLSNPKVAIFFVAFLPAFADPLKGSVQAQLLVLGALFMLAAALVFSAIAWLSGYLGELLRRSEQAQIRMQRLAGSVYLALAASLIIT